MPRSRCQICWLCLESPWVWKNSQRAVRISEKGNIQMLLILLLHPALQQKWIYQKVDLTEFLDQSTWPFKHIFCDQKGDDSGANGESKHVRGGSHHPWSSASHLLVHSGKSSSSCKNSSWSTHKIVVLMHILIWPQQERILMKQRKHSTFPYLIISINKDHNHLWIDSLCW